uniref:Uncharacterized protein n=1 Tax=Lepeophtheirus salmonis TaxID=72036 RepID=A0A0K2UXA0_LEPSM
MSYERDQRILVRILSDAGKKTMEIARQLGISNMNPDLNVVFEHTSKKDVCAGSSWLTTYLSGHRKCGHLLTRY